MIRTTPPRRTTTLALVTRSWTDALAFTAHPFRSAPSLPVVRTRDPRERLAAILGDQDVLEARRERADPRSPRSTSVVEHAHVGPPRAYHRGPPRTIVPGKGARRLGFRAVQRPTDPVPCELAYHREACGLGRPLNWRKTRDLTSNGHSPPLRTPRHCDPLSTRGNRRHPDLLISTVAAVESRREKPFARDRSRELTDIHHHSTRISDCRDVSSVGRSRPHGAPRRDRSLGGIQTHGLREPLLHLVELSHRCSHWAPAPRQPSE